MNPLDRIRIVLHRPENPTNIGAVVRAMQNMGVAQLRLVQPPPFVRDDLLRLAHRCEEVVDRIETYATLEAALADAAFVVGTAAIAHGDFPISGDVRTLAAELIERASTEPVALLFGTEADGLDRYALDRCHLIATLPANPAYPALNLAQSVLLFLYELRMAADDAEPSSAAMRPLAVHEDLERVFQTSEEALECLGFFKYNPTAVMHTLRRIVYRAALSPAEAALLLAIARQATRVGRNPQAARQIDPASVEGERSR